jgi:hypothetical protein
MTNLSGLNALTSVPYRHKVSAVARVAPVSLNLSAPLNPYAKAGRDSKTEQARPAMESGRYSARAAAPGFVAHILVEAGLTGSDPFAGTRGAQAYAAPIKTEGSLRLVA